MNALAETPTEPASPRSAPAPRAPRSRLALGVALFVGAVLVRLPGLGRSLFYDELFTAKTFATSLANALLTQKQANNHPLASLLAWASTRLLGRDDALALRAPSVLVGALAVVATAWLAGRRASGVVALVAGLLALAHPAHVGFSQEVRGYALVLLFTPLVLRLALDVLDGERRAAGFLVVCVALGVWSHATFGVLALGLTGYLFFCKGVRPEARALALVGVVGGGALGALLLAPTWSHLEKFAFQNTGLSGAGGGFPTPARLEAVAEMLSVGDARLGALWPVGVGLATLVALGLIAQLGRRCSSETAVHAASPAVEAAIAWVFLATFAVWSIARPLFYARFFAFLLPLAIVLAARGASALARRLAGGEKKRTLVLFLAAPLLLGWSSATVARAGWETQPTAPAIAYARERGDPERETLVIGLGSELLVPLSVSGWLADPERVGAVVELFPGDPVNTWVARWQNEPVEEYETKDFPGLSSDVRVHLFRTRR